MLVRDPDDRVLLCQLTYKQDWDLPGGVVEVGESPQVAVAARSPRSSASTSRPGNLVAHRLAAPWGGWDDALCLVFDGGVHPAAIVEDDRPQEREIRAAEFCTAEQVRERAADFTARGSSPPSPTSAPARRRTPSPGGSERAGFETGREAALLNQRVLGG